MRVIEKGFTDLSQSIHIQDNEDGCHDQNEGVPKEGDPPPPPPPPPPPSVSTLEYSFMKYSLFLDF